MSCNNLTVQASNPYTLSPGGELHGHLESATPQVITYSNTGYYGPDARVVVYQDKEIVAILECQQNYCFMEAGEVTVQTLSGSVPTKKEEGSYADGRGGKIYVG